ncbi:hypothetical protein [Rhodococcus qingshengii]|uniref:hypothetical protein n=1 Tax=Rhodococcus qingshengii TaxID=334542 RepID=UPI0035D6C422
MDPDTDRQAAIAALRDWKDNDDRRNAVVYQAHLAGLSLSEIHAECGLAINTIRSAISSEREKNMPNENDPLASYHHPHFVSVKPGPWLGEFQYTFKPFTGEEPQPTAPAITTDANISRDDLKALRKEYRAATESWAQARFHKKARPVVTTVLPGVWDAYASAMSKLEQAFLDLQNAGEGLWHSRVMALTFLRDAVVSAACDWDQEFRQVGDMYQEYFNTVGEEDAYNLSRLISGYGVDVGSWHTEPSHGQWADVNMSLREVVDHVIDQQDKRIKKVKDLAG